VWLKPELVAQIEFTEWTPDGHLRHSRFVGMREDKAAREVVREGEPSKENTLRLYAQLSFSCRVWV
jgi:ATP-dependent DNA ligase